MHLRNALCLAPIIIRTIENTSLVRAETSLFNSSLDLTNTCKIQGFSPQTYVVQPNKIKLKCCCSKALMPLRGVSVKIKKILSCPR